MGLVRSNQIRLGEYRLDLDSLASVVRHDFNRVIISLLLCICLWRPTPTESCKCRPQRTVHDNLTQRLTIESRKVIHRRKNSRKSLGKKRHFRWCIEYQERGDFNPLEFTHQFFPNKNKRRDIEYRCKVAVAFTNALVIML
jgi:hypothetical protein